MMQQNYCLGKYKNSIYFKAKGCFTNLTVQYPQAPKV